MHFSDIVRLTYKKKSGKINAIEFIPGVYITQNAALGKKNTGDRAGLMSLT